MLYALFGMPNLQISCSSNIELREKNWFWMAKVQIFSYVSQ